MAKDEELYQQIKEEEKEVIVMCESLDRMREEARAEGKIQGEEKADRRDGAGQISELEWNGNVCFRRIELYSDA